MAAMYKLPATALPGLTAIPTQATTTVLATPSTVVLSTAVIRLLPSILVSITSI